MQRCGDEIQPQRRQQQAQEQPLPASHQRGRANDDTEQRKGTASIRPAFRVAQHLSGVDFQEPQRQLSRLHDRRKAVGPVGLHRLLVRRAKRILAEDHYRGKAHDQKSIIDDPRKPAQRQ